MPESEFKKVGRLLCEIQGVLVVQDDKDNRVYFVADADIDADGANGQNGKQAAYMVDNKGSEHLGNGGMKMLKGKVVGASEWYDDIVILDDDGQPKVFPDGVIASKTAYRFHGLKRDDPAAYVDSETVPYAVVSPRIRNRARGVVLGCRAKITNTLNQQSIEAVVADIGPRDKIGELSIAAARGLSIPSNPRTGGVSSNVIKYELFPGTPADVNGVKYALIPA